MSISLNDHERRIKALESGSQSNVKIDLLYSGKHEITKSPLPIPQLKSYKMIYVSMINKWKVDVVLIMMKNDVYWYWEDIGGSNTTEVKLVFDDNQIKCTMYYNTSFITKVYGIR